MGLWETEYLPAAAKISRPNLDVDGRVNLINMILMPQFLYVIHNSPVVIPLKTFRIVNSLFCLLIWKNCSPRIKLEHLQRPKDKGGLALPNTWLYNLAAQLQHLIGLMGRESDGLCATRSSSETVMLNTVKRDSVLGWCTE